MRKKTKENLQNLDLSIYTKNGKLRKRKQKTNRNYFTQETEDAIISFTKTDNQKERNKLFNDHINYSIHKLAENIINTFKFYGTDLNIEDLKHEVVYFLIEKMPLYDQLQGKAYSYFGTIAKRYLIVLCEKQRKIRDQRKDIDDVDEDKKILRGEAETEKNLEISHFVKSYVRFVELNIDDIHENRFFNKDGILVKEYITFSDKDKSVVLTVLNLFKKVDELDVFYKPALYLHIREITGQKTTDITRVVKIMKCIMKQQLNIYSKKGCLDIDETDIYTRKVTQQ